MEHIKNIIKKCMRGNKVKKFVGISIALVCMYVCIILCHRSQHLFGGEELYMLSPQTNSQMMSFIIKTVNNKIIVIDGGSAGDAEHLVRNIEKISHMCDEKNNCVIDAWFLTHLHYDHTGALADILSNSDKYSNININNIYYQFPPQDFVEKNEPEYLDNIIAINSGLSQTKCNKLQVKKFQKICVDNVCFMPLNDIDLAITNNAVNNTSIVYKVTMSNGETILFLGDVGYEMGNKILFEVDDEIIRSDIVQMSHHGQYGVSEKFYITVSPKICLWPTPEWLWDNNTGGGKGSGPWTIDCEKIWMRRLNVKKHYMPLKEDIVLK